MRITLNFHPDPAARGVHILHAMAHDGHYLSQFETGTSNGGLSAHPGGARWRWEQSIFGGAYDDAPAAERPKYGALDHRRRPLGGAPRFGSAHVRLREHMLDRATFCFPDSAMSPTHFATAHRFDLLSHALEHDEAMCQDPDDEERDPLDGYVEALIMDPCYRGTDIEEKAHGLGLPLEWHEGHPRGAAAALRLPGTRASSSRARRRSRWIDRRSRDRQGRPRRTIRVADPQAAVAPHRPVGLAEDLST